ncbi:MAG: cobyric acid synthase [Oscillibacter sp.]|nr:cobyric acid synthase [Oscillibacter sp.]
MVPRGRADGRGKPPPDGGITGGVGRVAKRLMVQGTMSGAGKSLLCTGLCRIFRQDGLRVAPFKSQNMSLNSYVTADGREIGRAQAVQAQAAGIAPDARMNPVLLKPSSDTGSQVIVNGAARGHMGAVDYFRYRESLIPEILSAFDSLAAEYDVIVIEGAGSPAEINLRENDIVNMGLAELTDAPVILVGDIDRGGVFAQLYGTVALLTPLERARVRGFVINKFRGDLEILRPGLAELETLTGIPVLGVVPYLQADIDDEDSLSPALSRDTPGDALDIAVIRFPRLSNFTDFAPLGVRYVDRAPRLGAPDMVILPGTKSTVADLLWARQNGLESAILKLAARGTPILGICGGYQMLGERIDDPHGAESALPTLRGMGLLPCRTVFAASKTLRRARGVATGGPFDGAALDGYEIHMGVTEARGPAFCLLDGARPDGCRRGNVMGTYLHGLFDSGEAAQKLRAWLLARKGIASGDAKPESREAYRERQYDLLAAGVRAALDMDALRRILEG